MIKDNQAYTLEPISRDGVHYQHAGNYKSVETGDQLKPETKYYGELISAELTQFTSQENAHIKSSKLQITGFHYTLFGNTRALDSLSITVHFNNQEKNLYFAMIKNIELDLEPVNPYFPALMRKFNFHQQKMNEYTINASNDTFYGIKAIKICYVGGDNKKYVAFYNIKTRN